MAQKKSNRFGKEVLILIVDDDVAHGSYVKDLLVNLGAQVIIALDGKQGMELFYSMRPNFVFLGMNLEDMSGFQVLDQIADTASTRHIAVVMIGDAYSHDDMIQAYKRGAMDYFSKPVDPEVIVAYLFNRDKLRKIITESIWTDALTGVGNRRYFDDILNYFGEMKKSEGAPYSLILLDLDHFKAINDTYGHPAGDDVLRKMGEITKREADYVFRYGGEEFAILINEGSIETAVALVERVREEFNKQIFQKNDATFSVTFSSGIASFDGEFPELVRGADQALYQAKRSGRNRTVIYDVDEVDVKRKLNIILVDDDRLTRTMLFDKLILWDLPDIDIAVSVYSDGLSFLEADWYKEDEHYIILLDGVMPEMDGLEVLTRLKNEQTEKNVKVSMMTSRSADSDIKAALWLGADDYIMKPVKAEDVFFRIQQMASRLFT